MKLDVLKLKYPCLTEDDKIAIVTHSIAYLWSKYPEIDCQPQENWQPYHREKLWQIINQIASNYSED